MKIVLQRVTKSSVSVAGQYIGQINRGILILLGVHKEDSKETAEFLANKCADLRIFQDDQGKMNLSLADTAGGALVVSQFTLYGNCNKGKRPSFMEAALPDKGNELYLYFVDQLKKRIQKVETGKFGAIMEVSLVNDGPVTLVLER